MYLTGTQAATLALQYCGMIQYFETIGIGGFFYVGSPSFTLDKTGGTNWNHLNATQAGYCDGTASGVDSSFSLACMLGNITQNISAVNPPPYASGGLNVKNCNIVCQLWTT